MTPLIVVALMTVAQICPTWPCEIQGVRFLHERMAEPECPVVDRNLSVTLRYAPQGGDPTMVDAMTALALAAQDKGADTVMLTDRHLTKARSGRVRTAVASGKAYRCGK